MSKFAVVALLIFASVVAAQQTVLAPAESFVDTEVAASTVYTAYMYYGEEEDDCFLSDDETGQGILFTDTLYSNVCLSYKGDTLYIKGEMDDGEKTLLFRVGDGTYSVAMEYRPATSKKLTIKQGGTETSDFEAVTTEKVDIMFIVSIQEAKVLYGSTYALDISWMVDYKDTDTYTVEVEVSKDSEECFTPTTGRLEGFELCLDFASDSVLTITANDVTIGVYSGESTGQTITFMYQNADDFMYITRSGSTQALFYVPSSQVYWIYYEGDIPAYTLNTIYYLELENASDESSDGYNYSCINVYNKASVEAVLYQEIQIVCGECSYEDDYCALKAYILDGKPQTLTAFELLQSGTVLEIKYDSQIEFWSYEVGTTEVSIFADELIIYSIEGANDFSYRPLIGDINFESDGDNTEYEAEWTLEIEDGEIMTIEFESDDENGMSVELDLYCEEDACYLGKEDGDSFDVYKKYEGSYTQVSLYYIDEEADDETCISFTDDEGTTFNHCGFYAQWEMYYHTFNIEPVEVLDISE